MRNFLIFLLFLAAVGVVCKNRVFKLDGVKLRESLFVKSVMIKERGNDSITLGYSAYKPVALLNSSYMLLENGKLMKITPSSGSSLDALTDAFADGRIDYHSLVRILKDIKSNDVDSLVKEVSFVQDGDLYTWYVVTNNNVPVYMGEIRNYDPASISRLSWLLNGGFNLAKCEYIKLYFKDRLVYKLRG